MSNVFPRKDSPVKTWTVLDVMTKGAIAVHEDTPYQEIVNTLAEHHVSAVPVIDHHRRVLGVVSESDLLHKMEFVGEDTEPRTFEWGSKKVNRAKARAGTAKDLMTAPAITVEEQVPVVRAARLLAEHDIKRLPVVDFLGRLAGVVSRGDLLRIYLRDDTEIRDDIVEGVLRKVLWIDPMSVQVDVTDGFVRLSGKVEHRSTADILTRVTQAVAGVTGVEEKLTWDNDDVSAMAGTGL